MMTEFCECVELLGDRIKGVEYVSLSCFYSFLLIFYFLVDVGKVLIAQSANGPEYLYCLYSLWANMITSKGAIIFFNSLKMMHSTIAKIDLAANQLDDACLVPLGEYIKQSNSLESIWIRDNRITDVGIELISPYIIGNTTLKHFGIQENKHITDKSIPLLQAIIQNSHLENIYTNDTSISKRNALVLPLATSILKNKKDRIEFGQK